MPPISTFHTGLREDPVCVSFQEETAWSESLCVQMPAERTLPLVVWVPHSVPPQVSNTGDMRLITAHFLPYNSPPAGELELLFGCCLSSVHIALSSLSISSRLTDEQGDRQQGSGGEAPPVRKPVTAAPAWVKTPGSCRHLGHRYLTSPAGLQAHTRP